MCDSIFRIIIVQLVFSWTGYLLLFSSIQTRQTGDYIYNVALLSS